MFATPKKVDSGRGGLVWMDSREGVTVVVVATQSELGRCSVLTKRQVRVQARRVPAAGLYPTNVTFTFTFAPRC